MSSVHGLDHWKQAFCEYLETHGYAQRTVEEYGADVGRFLRWVETQGVSALSQITREVLVSYQSHLYTLEKKGKRLALGTQVKILAAIRTFFLFLVKRNFLLADPAADLELPKTKKGLPKGVMTRKEVLKVLEQPECSSPLGLRDRAMLELLYSSGIRSAELRSLSLYDIDWSASTLLIRKGKNQKSRLVPVGEVAAFFLQRYLEEARPAFVRDPQEQTLFLSVRGRKLARSNLLVRVKTYVKRAKLKKAIGVHAFRHTCATHLLQGKADLRAIQELLGHASVATTQIYTKVDLSDLKRVHARCHPREHRGECAPPSSP